MNYRYLIPFVFLAAFTMYLSGVPSLGASITNDFINQILRKSGHVLFFLGLTYLLWMSLPAMDRRRKFKTGFCVAILLIFAGTTEAYQTFVPGRQGNLVGFGFDALGIAIMAAYLLKGSGRRINERCGSERGWR